MHSRHKPDLGATVCSSPGQTVHTAILTLVLWGVASAVLGLEEVGHPMIYPLEIYPSCKLFSGSWGCGLWVPFCFCLSHVLFFSNWPLYVRAAMRLGGKKGWGPLDASPLHVGVMTPSLHPTGLLLA